MEVEGFSFVCCLFNDAVNISGHMKSNDRMSNKYRIEKDIEGCGLGYFEVLSGIWLDRLRNSSKWYPSREKERMPPKHATAVLTPNAH